MTQLPLTEKQKTLIRALYPGLKAETLGTEFISIYNKGRLVEITFLGDNGYNTQLESWASLKQSDIQKFMDIGFLRPNRIDEEGYTTNFVLDEFSIIQAVENDFNVLALEQTSSEKRDSKTIFVVHGRNTKVRDDLFLFLLSIGLEPIEWSDAVQMTKKGAPFIGEVVEKAISKPQAIIVLMTPDDEARLLPPYLHQNDPDYEKFFTPQPRPNVLFEAGMAIALRPDHTIFVELGQIRPFSDISGRHRIRLDNEVGTRREIARRLKYLGCSVSDLESSIQWQTAGDFGLQEEQTSTNVISYPNFIKSWRVRPGELIGDAGESSEGESWTINIKQAQGKGIYGPYTMLHPNRYRATFRLKIDDHNVKNERLVTLDVTSNVAEKYLALRTLNTGDFNSSDSYQDFHLDFEVITKEPKVEFRIRTDPYSELNRLLTLACVEIWSA